MKKFLKEFPQEPHAGLQQHLKQRKLLHLRVVPGFIVQRLHYFILINCKHSFQEMKTAGVTWNIGSAHFWTITKFPNPSSIGTMGTSAKYRKSNKYRWDFGQHSEEQRPQLTDVFKWERSRTLSVGRKQSIQQSLMVVWLRFCATVKWSLLAVKSYSVSRHFNCRISQQRL